MASFNVDDIVYVLPADKKHPAIAGASSQYGRVLATMVNGQATTYRVAILGLPGVNHLLDASEISAVTGPISSTLVAKLPTPTVTNSTHKR